MKFGYVVTGKDDRMEFTSGEYDTKHQVIKCYKFMMASKQYSDKVKKTFKICEMRAVDITAELLGE